MKASKSLIKFLFNNERDLSKKKRQKQNRNIEKILFIRIWNVDQDFLAC